MKNFTVVFMFLVCILHANAQKEDYVFNFSEANKEWNEDHLNIENQTISVDCGQDESGNDIYGNAAVSWFNNVITDISGYYRLVLELEEATTARVEVVVSKGGFWGPYANKYLDTGETELSIVLEDLVYTVGEDDILNTPLDLTQVNLIYIRSDWVNKQTIKVKSFRLEYFKEYETILTDKYPTETSSFDFSEANKEWNEDHLNIENQTISMDLGQDESGNDIYGNAAVSWFNNVTTDISGYYRLVLELEEATTALVEVVVSKGGFWGPYANKYLYTGETELSIVLEDLVYTVGEDDVLNTPLDLTQVNLIYIRSDWVNKQTIKVKSFRLEKCDNYSYFIRENSTPETYYTMCLPFTSTVNNATIYEVKGVDNKENPSTVYLETVDTLEANKAYMILSTDDNDITFTQSAKSSEEEAQPISNEALVGTYDTIDISNGYILKNNAWYPVTDGTSSTKLKPYRAYLNVDNAEVVEETSTAKKMSVYNSGETTAINNIESTSNASQVSTLHNLAGQRVNNNFHGIVIKNGKKYFNN